MGIRDLSKPLPTECCWKTGPELSFRERRYILMTADILYE
jgi:hypothetical protein